MAYALSNPSVGSRHGVIVVHRVMVGRPRDASRVLLRRLDIGGLPQLSVGLASELALDALRDVPSQLLLGRGGFHRTGIPTSMT